MKKSFAEASACKQARAALVTSREPWHVRSAYLEKDRRQEKEARELLDARAPWQSAVASSFRSLLLSKGVENCESRFVFLAQFERTSPRLSSLSSHFLVCVSQLYLS